MAAVNAHLLPQAPQLLASVARLTSQVPPTPSQSAVGAVQVALEHTPPLQDDLAQGTPQPPQSVSVSSGVSQLVPSWLQSPKPWTQSLTLHAPVAQVAVA